jgi:hypothetical protein
MSSAKTTRTQILISKYPDIGQKLLDTVDEKYHKYLLWMAKQLTKGYSMPDIMGSVNYFDRNSAKLSHRDIYQYEEQKTLEDEIKKLGESKRQKDSQAKDYGSVVIFEDDNFKVVRLNNWDSVALYGKESQWCITQEDSTYWEEYCTGGSVFYVMLVKNKGVYGEKKNTKDEYSCLGKDKFCIQKESFTITVWSPDDSEYCIEDFTSEVPLAEDALLSVLHDRDKSLFWLLREKKSIDPVMLDAWLSAQHKKTIDWLTTKYARTLVKSYLGKSIDLISKLNKKDIAELVSESPDFFDNTLKFLRENKTNHTKLRKNLIASLPKEKTAGIEPVAKPPKPKTISKESMRAAVSGNGKYKDQWEEFMPKLKCKDLFECMDYCRNLRRVAIENELKKRLNIDNVLHYIKNWRGNIHETYLTRMFGE